MITKAFTNLRFGSAVSYKNDSKSQLSVHVMRKVTKEFKTHERSNRAQQIQERRDAGLDSNACRSIYLSTQVGSTEKSPERMNRLSI